MQRRRVEGCEKAIERVTVELHPTANIRFDSAPSPYTCDPLLHGPSRHTVAVRKLTRKKLAKMQPWIDLEVETAVTNPPPVTAEALAHGVPSAEEEAAAFFERERFWGEEEQDPFVWQADANDNDRMGYAAGFWQEVPRAVPAEVPGSGGPACHGRGGCAGGRPG